MRRYLLFAYSNYYPRGGWSDFKDSFESIQDVLDTVIYWDNENETYCVNIHDNLLDEDGETNNHVYDRLELIDGQTGDNLTQEIHNIFKPK